MNWLRVIRARVVGLFRKEELEQEIDEELRFHVAMRTEENIARGMSPPDAARAAQRQLGNVDLIKDACRDVNGGGAFDSFWQDVRFACRMLRKDRAFTIVAVVALALGIGANTALFTVLSNVLLRPLGYPGADEIMSISMRDSIHPPDSFPVSYPDFIDLRTGATTFERFGAFRAGSFVVRSAVRDATQVGGAWVTSDIFPLLGVKPLIGRTFVRAEEEPGRRSVVISHEMWESHFGKAANILKAALMIDGVDFAVIGVMPPGFQFPVQNAPAQFWITFAHELEPLADGTPSYPFRRDSHFLRVLGRLKPGSTAAQATDDLNAIAAQLGEQYPETNRNYTSCIMLPWLEEITKSVRPMLLMLIGAASFALCVACANVANLLLARASVRSKEIALRVALGAGRRRIMRQLLTESLVLAAIGGAAGLLLALAGTRYIVSALPEDFPRAAEISPDIRVLAFTALVTLFTSCLFGIAPGWRSARTKLTPLLNDAGQSPSDSPGGRRARRMLVVAEMVLAFILLGGACFFLVNLAQLKASPLGFDPQNVISAQVVVPDAKDAGVPERAVRFFDEMLERVSHLAGVQSASLVSRLPLSGARSIADFEIAEKPMHPADLPLAEPHIVTAGYFETMRVPILSGRDFSRHDNGHAAPVVIVNETLARQFFPGENAVGKRIKPGLYVDPWGPVEREIIAVVGDVRSDMLTRDQQPQFYVPLPQCTLLDMALVIRSDVPVDELMQEVHVAIGELDPNVAVDGGSTMQERVTGAVATPRLNSTLLAAFAAVAVLLTAIGVYGVMAYSVAQRRHEIGIRLALGAQKNGVFRLIIGEGVQLIGFSIVVGAICTAIMLPGLQTFAYGAAHHHLLIVLFPAFLLAAVALLACWVPARRAAELDPLAALGQR